MYILKFKHSHFTPDDKEWYETCCRDIESMEHLIDSLEGNEMIKCWMIEGHSSESLGLQPITEVYMKEFKLEEDKVK